MSRKISAHYIFQGKTPPLKRGIIALDDNGVIAEVTDTYGKLDEAEKLEFFSGIIIPRIPDSSFKPTLLPVYSSSFKAELPLLKLLRQIQQNHVVSTTELIISIFTNLQMPQISIEAGRNPGLWLISNISFPDLALTEKSTLEIIA